MKLRKFAATLGAVGILLGGLGAAAAVGAPAWARTSAAMSRHSLPKVQTDGFGT
jgi:hypothetical protein